ncbi:MAG: hypothetical protein VCC99_00580 [Alphaproteobacteria bacterium]
MTLSGYGGRFERRNRNRWRMAMFKTLLYTGVIGIFSFWAYNMGEERAENRNRSLEEKMAVLDEENLGLKEETEAAVSARVAAVERASKYQRQYEQEVPQGPLYDIMKAVQGRMAAGVSPDRIAFVLGAVENETRCAPDIKSRRFILRTAISSGGANNSVSFADNAITVTGAGESSRDAAGNAQAWFDGTQPVSLQFAVPGGQTTKAEGPLPLHHAVVINDKVHRFTVTDTDAKGFVLVTGQACDYP